MFYDLINFLVVFIFMLVLKKDKKINQIEFLCLVIHIFCVFLLNNFLIAPEYMPDQYKYLNTINMIRDGNVLSLSEEPITVASASLFFAFFPLPFIHSVTSIAIINFLLFSLFFIYIIRKNIFEQTPRLFYLLYPSLLLYSSLALRDTLILICMYFFIYHLLFKKSKIMMLFMVLFLALIKFQNALILALVFILNKMISSKDSNKILAIILMVAATTLFLNFIGFEQLEFYRKAMYVEDGGFLADELPPITILGLIVDAFYFLIKPLPYEASNIFQLIQSIENIFVIFLLFINVRFQIKNNLFKKEEFVQLNLFFLISMILYGAVVFNFGTAARYRFTFIVVYILLCAQAMQKYGLNLYTKYKKKPVLKPFSINY